MLRRAPLLPTGSDRLTCVGCCARTPLHASLAAAAARLHVSMVVMCQGWWLVCWWCAVRGASSVRRVFLHTRASHSPCHTCGAAVAAVFPLPVLHSQADVKGVSQQQLTTRYPPRTSPQLRNNACNADATALSKLCDANHAQQPLWRV